MHWRTEPQSFQCVSFFSPPPLHKGELQRSCSRTVAEKVSEQCQLACHCRRYPPLPPPPPPPPPPRLLIGIGKTPRFHACPSASLCLLAPHSWGSSCRARCRCRAAGWSERTVFTWSVSFCAQRKNSLRLECAVSVQMLQPAGCWQLNTGLIYNSSDLGEYPAACELHACWAAKLSGSVVGFPPEDPWLKYRWVH